MSEESRPEATKVAPKRRADVPKKKTVGRVILASLVVLAMITGLGVVYAYVRFNGNIDRVSVDSKIDERVVKRGPKGALNVLVMGSDTRSGDNRIDKEEGLGGSDTTILLHLSEDRTRAYGVSIPRDSLVDRPDCGGDNEIAGATQVKWNQAYAVGEAADPEGGGAACALEQVEATTGIAVDYYVVVDFSGFKEMVDALDGVPVCIPKDIVDPGHGIMIESGEREISGDEALDYVRVRHNVGDQSDLGRIKRQQTFMAAMIKKVTSAGIIARPDKLLGFLDAVTSAVQTDFKSVAQLGGLARQLQSVGLDNIKFVTVPWEYIRPDYDVNWVEPEASRLWELLIADKVLPAKYLNGSISAANAPGKDPTAQPEPAETPSGSASETPSGTPSGTPSETPSETSSEAPSETVSPSPTPTPEETEVDKEAAEDAGLCA